MSFGWKTCRLGDLTTVITKGTTPTSVGFKFLDNGVNFIKIESITKTGTFIKNKFAYISEKANLALKRSQLQEGDILFSIAGALGRTAVVTKDILPANTNQALSIIRLKENSDILTKYILSALTTGFALEQIEKFKGGVAQQNLSLGQMKEFQILIPPISEQKEIIEILDKAFKSIEKAKANIEKNIENAKELFQSKLNQIFSQTGEGWKEKKIIELCKHKSQIVGGPFGSNLKVKDYKEQGIPILRLQNIGKGYFIDKAIKYISEEKAKELSYHSFNAGDIALAKLGIPIGKTCIIPNEFKYGIVVADVVRIRPNKEQVNYDFLKYFLNSDCSVSQLTADIKGATRPRVNIAEVRDLKLSIPNTTKQKEIVETLDIMDNHIQSLLASYEEELKNLEELKKSILQKAFSGELTNKNKAV